MIPSNPVRNRRRKPRPTTLGFLLIGTIVDGETKTFTVTPRISLAMGNRDQGRKAGINAANAVKGPDSVSDTNADVPLRVLRQKVMSA